MTNFWKPLSLIERSVLLMGETSFMVINVSKQCLLLCCYTLAVQATSCATVNVEKVENHTLKCIFLWFTVDQTE